MRFIEKHFIPPMFRGGFAQAFSTAFFQRWFVGGECALMSEKLLKKQSLPSAFLAFGLGLLRA
jgi:hypothetical protein